MYCLVSPQLGGVAKLFCLEFSESVMSVLDTLTAQGQMTSGATCCACGAVGRKSHQARGSW